MLTLSRLITALPPSRHGPSSLRFLALASKQASGGPSSVCSKLTLIGGGKMAEAILNALLTKKIQRLQDIMVVDPNGERLAYLREKFIGVKTATSFDKIKGSDIVVLAVKPQHVDQVANGLADDSLGGALVLSIVAGCTIQTLKDKFRTERVIRSMPNTPASILEGITVWTASPQSPADSVDKARLMLAAMGEQISVSDESYLDMATAISGSGPAYVFLVIEALIDAAVHIGFPREIATKLVIHTVRGSASYAEHAGVPVSDLRNNVTSPGGTTASALFSLERGGFRTVLSEGVWSAYRKALELGGKNSNVGPDRNMFNPVAGKGASRV